MKCVGKKRKGLEKVPYVLPDGISTLRELIDVITRQEVAAYNARGTDNMLVNFLTDESIAAKATVGKVEFGRLYSENKADPDKSSQAAIQGFEDGLFRVLVGETEASELDGQVSIKDGDTLTFIRLAFLAGRLW
jgi:hypothetical protein